jgi:hypothetical protein
MTGAFEEYSVIHKEKYFDIIYHEHFKKLGINNHSSKYLNVELVDLKKNYSLQGLHSLKILNFLSVPVNEVKEITIIISEPSTKEIFFYSYYFDGLTYKLVDLNKNKNSTVNDRYVVFTGHMGGGTSVVVKLLRYLGVYFGDDCGDIDNRKTHESISFRHFSGLLDHSEPNDNIFESLNKVKSIYNINEGLNCFKNVKISKNLTYFSNIIKDYKVVSVIKEPNNYFNTPEGERFYNSSKIELMEYQRPLVEGVPMFHLDFYKFFTDYTYVNKVLNFIGHDKLIDTEEEFIDLKNKIDFNEKALER